jgi:hypothetical protein
VAFVIDVAALPAVSKTTLFLTYPKGYPCKPDPAWVGSNKSYDDNNQIVADGGNCREQPAMGVVTGTSGCLNGSGRSGRAMHCLPNRRWFIPSRYALSVDWLAAGLGAAYLQDRADLQQRAVTIAHQLELQFAQANTAWPVLMQLCLAASEPTSRLLAAVSSLRRMPAMRCVLPRMAGCAARIFPVLIIPAVAAGSS